MDKKLENKIICISLPSCHQFCPPEHQQQSNQKKVQLQTLSFDNIYLIFTGIAINVLLLFTFGWHESIKHVLENKKSCSLKLWKKLP